MDRFAGTCNVSVFFADCPKENRSFAMILAGHLHRFSEVEWQPMDFHQISTKKLRKFEKGPWKYRKPSQNNAY